MSQNKCPKCEFGNADWLGVNIINEIDKETGHYKEFDRYRCSNCGYIWRELIKGGTILKAG